MTRAARKVFLISLAIYLVGYASTALFILLTKNGPDEFFPGWTSHDSEPGGVAMIAGVIGFTCCFSTGFVVYGALLPAEGERARWRIALGMLLMSGGLMAPFILEMMRFWVLKAVLVGFPIGAVACLVLARSRTSDAETVFRVFE